MSNLTKLERWIKDHGPESVARTVDSNGNPALRLGLWWSNPEQGTEGVDYETVRTIDEAKRVLGY